MGALLPGLASDAAAPAAGGCMQAAAPLLELQHLLHMLFCVQIVARQAVPDQLLTVQLLRPAPECMRFLW